MAVGELISLHILFATSAIDPGVAKCFFMVSKPIHIFMVFASRPRYGTVVISKKHSFFILFFPLTPCTLFASSVQYSLKVVVRKRFFDSVPTEQNEILTLFIENSFFESYSGEKISLYRHLQLSLGIFHWIGTGGEYHILLFPCESLSLCQEPGFRLYNQMVECT